MLIRYGTDERGKPVKKALIYTKLEHGIAKDKIDVDALRIIERLRGAGFSAYIVGGAVRDLIAESHQKNFQKCAHYRAPFSARTRRIRIEDF